MDTTVVVALVAAAGAVTATTVPVLMNRRLAARIGNPNGFVSLASMVHEVLRMLHRHEERLDALERDESGPRTHPPTTAV